MIITKFILAAISSLVLISCGGVNSVECKDGNVAEVISGFKSGTKNKLVMSGTVNDETFKKIGKALKQDKTVKVYLDLSNVNGLKTYKGIAAGGNSPIGVSLPPTVTNVSGSALGGADEFEYIDFPKGNDKLTVDNNVVYDKKKTVLFAAPRNLKNITIPDTVTKINDSSLTNNECLESITIPESVSTLENNLNNMKALKKVVFKGEMETVYKVLQNCPALQSVEFTKKINHLKYSIEKCPELIELKMNEEVSDIYNSINNLDKIKSINLPYMAFCWASFKELPSLENINTEYIPRDSLIFCTKNKRTAPLTVTFKKDIYDEIYSNVFTSSDAIVFLNPENIRILSYIEHFPDDKEYDFFDPSYIEEISDIKKIPSEIINDPAKIRDFLVKFQNKIIISTNSDIYKKYEKAAKKFNKKIE